MNFQDKDTQKSEGGLEEAVKGLPVSRRWLLRNTANAAAGAIAVSALGAGATATKAKAETTAAAGTSYPEQHDAHADKPAGYVHSLHGWDTI